MVAGVAAALAVAGSAGAKTAKPRVFPVEARPVLEDRYPARVTKWPHGVTSMADVVYQTLPGYRPQIVDIYMPARRGGAKPLVLYVHGGGWVGGHTRHAGPMGNFPAALAELASEGFVVASLEYRLAGEARFPAQVQDVRAALRFLKGNATKYGIDPARAGIWGGSAGGHLSALAALSCGVGSLEAQGVTAPPGSECVQSAVIWYGVFDFAALAAARANGGDGAAERLMGCTGPCTPEQYAPASPVTYIDAKDPPFLLIHGEGDRTVPVAQSHLAEDRMLAAGMKVESIYIPGVDHSFIGATPEATRTATLKAMNATYDFFHKTLDGAGK
ncbi:MAG: alpha/beta hydrolase [Sphingomonadales bacterium]|nr:alpha/beta hydrolase [Sphingomonadales bacterium]